MEPKEEETKTPTTTTEEGSTKVVEIEQKQINDHVKQKKVSPFVNQSVEWDDSALGIPAEIIKAIKEVLLWDNPSKIQSVAIPYVMSLDEETKTYDHLIAQAKNGAGKSGSFTIGSLLRVDPSISKTQVIVIGHTRELVN